MNQRFMQKVTGWTSAGLIALAWAVWVIPREAAANAETAIIGDVMHSYAGNVEKKIESMVANVTQKQNEPAAQQSPSWMQKAKQFQSDASTLQQKVTLLKSPNAPVDKTTLRQRVESGLAKLTSQYTSLMGGSSAANIKKENS
jgi:hypothetical protein